MTKKVVYLIIALVLLLAVGYYLRVTHNNNPLVTPTAPIPAKDVIHNPKAVIPATIPGPQTEKQFIQQENSTPTPEVRRTY